MKFSIIVPVYNVEKYISKCIESIINQTYKNFELIIVNDGSPDNSQKIIDKYVKKDKRIKSFIKENGGLSDARNYGLKYTTGDYLLFVDSDDSIEMKLLEKINSSLSKDKVDILRFECALYNEENVKIQSCSGSNYQNKDVDTCIQELITRKYVEPAWLYCYNIKFWRENNFKYQEGKIHEDFGLTPLILYKAKTISSIDYSGYKYLIRDGSITNSSNYSKTKKAVYDMLEQGKILNKLLEYEEDSIKKKAILNYINESLILKSRELNNCDRKKYISELRKEEINKKIYPYNAKKLLKKIISLISINIYIKIFGR